MKNFVLSIYLIIFSLFIIQPVQCQYDEFTDLTSFLGSGLITDMTFSSNLNELYLSTTNSMLVKVPISSGVAGTPSLVPNSGDGNGASFVTIDDTNQVLYYEHHYDWMVWTIGT